MPRPRKERRRTRRTRSSRRTPDTRCRASAERAHPSRGSGCRACRWRPRGGRSARPRSPPRQARARQPPWRGRRLSAPPLRSGAPGSPCVPGSTRHSYRRSPRRRSWARRDRAGPTPPPRRRRAAAPSRFGPLRGLDPGYRLPRLHRVAVAAEHASHAPFHRGEDNHYLAWLFDLEHGLALLHPLVAVPEPLGGKHAELALRGSDDEGDRRIVRGPPLGHPAPSSTTPAANAFASSGPPTGNARAPGTIRFVSFESTSPGPASTNVAKPAFPSVSIERCHRTG